MRPYYEHGGITIYHGDCREILPLLQFDVIVSDPPYGIRYRFHGGGDGSQGGKHATMRERSHPLVGDDQPFDPSPLLSHPAVLWGAMNYLKHLPSRGRWLVWDKHCSEVELSQSSIEMAWCSEMGPDRIFRHLWQGFLRQGENRWHPTQKPIALMAWCLQFVPSGVVCDPFAGTGTTLVAAKRTGRQAIGIEIEERYCEIAAQRLSQDVLPLLMAQKEESTQLALCWV